ncbi:class I SAM-dependent methyltransferase [Kribbella sp. NPDC051718]|uniref:class I SAM-dependent methyltransferase n=1 Tax=Kribbella sp. NPDC051718 TaxID=3155168 RepID=UPI0034330062
MTSDIRASYDVAAADYAKQLDHFLAENPYDRAMLDLFAELVTGRVGDLGCGPGRITPYLASRGLDAFGLDLSPGMVEVARKAYPELRFDVGDLLDLDLPDGELGGALAWYSLVHTPPEELPKVFAEIHRVLAPGGLLLHAWKIGTEGYHLDQAYGHPLSLDVFQYQVADVQQALTAAGFTELATFTHPPLDFEKQPQGYLLYRS